MQKHTHGSISWLTFDLFKPFPKLIHGVFLRHGGVSSNEYASLNCGASQEDGLCNVMANRKIVCDTLKITTWCGLKQCHGDTVIEANPNHLEEGDALVTCQPNIGLAIIHADCQAALIYDPSLHLLANVHCGWRGNVQNIYAKTIQTLVDRYGSKPCDLLVGISPSLGPSASEFINHATELPPHFSLFQFKENYFNLWEISRSQLLEAGILEQHIEIAQICTYSNPNDYFSYRRVKASGRHVTIGCLKG